MDVDLHDISEGIRQKRREKREKKPMAEPLSRQFFSLSKYRLGHGGTGPPAKTSVKLRIRGHHP
jgi:hypothetical protein